MQQLNDMLSRHVFMSCIVAAPTFSFADPVVWSQSALFDSYLSVQHPQIWLMLSMTTQPLQQRQNPHNMAAACFLCTGLFVLENVYMIAGC